MRLIDADALLESAGIFEVKACARGCGKSILHLAKVWLLNEVNNAPTVDAVPVVRCEKCVLHGNCITEDTFVFAGIENPFCCAGKRKKVLSDGLF